MYCSSCGTRAGDGDVFCRSCGTAMTPPVRTTTAQTRHPEAQAGQPQLAAAASHSAATTATAHRVNPDADPPRQRGWYLKPGDPAGVQRWHNGNGWTDRVTGGAPITRPTTPASNWQWGSPPARTAAGAAWSGTTSPLRSTAPRYIAPPSTATTIWITLFFGLFGLIPATVHTNHARDLGVRDNRYYRAFGWTFAIATVSWILFFVALVSCATSAANNYSTNYGGLPHPALSTHAAIATR